MGRLGWASGHRRRRSAVGARHHDDQESTMHTTTRRLLAVIAALAALGSGIGLSAGPGMAAAGSPVAPAPVLATPAGTAIPGRYIITTRAGADVGALTRAQNVTPSSTYSRVLNGFAAALTTDQLEAVRRSPDVVAIEEDRLWTI